MMATMRKVPVVGDLNVAQCRLGEARFDVGSRRLGHVSMQHGQGATATEWPGFVFKAAEKLCRLHARMQEVVKVNG